MAHRKAVIGNPASFWLYDSTTGFDLTHPATPTSAPVTPRVSIKTTTATITLHPPKTALVIVDMQNFFLSPQLGRPKDSAGLLAQQQLLTHAIPAARKAGIRVIWLNWGLTIMEVEAMPPATLRAFGFETVPAEELEGFAKAIGKQAAVDSHGVNEAALEIDAEDKAAKVETSGKNPRIYRGLGSEVGPVKLEDGSEVQGGGLLMRDAWNSALTPELDAAYREGLKASPPDVWIHKNRMSGLWGASSPCTEFLEKEGIKTLLFAGVNTDQCVGGSLQDAFTKGYDCVLLSDGAGTTSPKSSQESIEFNCAKTWGFCVSCGRLAEGVENMGG
jgi:nicotinamidase-related amidase